jgi:hypothetical protein
MGCDREYEEMRDAQNSRGSAGKVGRPFRPGQSGNPGGRPKGLARATRELVGDDGMKLAAFWLSIMEDPMRRDSDQLEASRLLADRGWGKAPAYAAIEEDNPLGLEDVEAAAEKFRRMVLRLADRKPDKT